MRVLMLCEYFPPFDSGGSEWSTFYLAKGISEKKIDSIVLTPNYGSSGSKQNLEGVKVIRFPFYKKLRGKKQLTPYWHTNTLWFIWSSLWTLYYALKSKADLIHIQGKYFLPAAMFTKLLTGKKVIFTARDYIILCPLGMCLVDNNKACSLTNFIKSDFTLYASNYLPNASKPRIFLQLLFSIRAKIISAILKSFLKIIDKNVTISKVSQNIYKSSGVKNIDVIPNSFDFKAKIKAPVEKQPVVIFAGRLTYGKGVKIFLETAPTVLRAYPKTTFLIAGEGFLMEELKKMCHKLGIKRKVKFLSHISHDRLLDYLSNSTCTVMPSIWPEPFGRTALESIAVGTPIVVSNRAGISEQISNRWGKVVEPRTAAIAQGIIFAIKNANNLRENITKDKAKIEKIWSTDVINSYAKVYDSLIK